MPARVKLAVIAWLAALSACALIATTLAPAARADGDPGSDVLVNQDLFIGASINLTPHQQIPLITELHQAAAGGVPVRVAVIGDPSDLGSVTPYWRHPAAYAGFLGIELEYAYAGRLLVVMPNGVGFFWKGHPSGPSQALLAKVVPGSTPEDLEAGAEAGVRALAQAAGAHVGAATSATAGSATSATAGSPTSGAVAGGAASSSTAPGTVPADQQPVILQQAAGVGSTTAHSQDTTVALVAVIVLLLGGVAGFAVRGRRRIAALMRVPAARGVAGGVLAGGLLLAVLIGASGARSPHGRSQAQLLADGQVDTGGPPENSPAPDFTLTDQFGKSVSLHQFRGKVVLMAFTDSECTTTCPLATTAMLQAKAMLGKAGSEVQLLGVDANPRATSLEDVQSYSEVHDMVHAWHFVTGTTGQLGPVWKAYKVQAAIDSGQIEHTPALFAIDPQGHQRKVWVTADNYSSVGQFSQEIAHELASLLPGDPPVHSDLSYAPIPGIPPTTAALLPKVGGGSVRIGPGQGHVYLFFATWAQEVTSLAGHLDALNAYQAYAVAHGLPTVVAVDEGIVEPSPSTVTTFLAGLPHPLSFPVGIDATGRVADGYEVAGQPWYVVTNGAGRILDYREVDTEGWLTEAQLQGEVEAALKTAPGPLSPAATQLLLKGSPAPLGQLHTQAGQLLGDEPALAARIRALRGYPIVINAWASWCAACRAEFGLFASASAQYGKHVAFLGADTQDSASDAQSFLHQHPVSYPSYAGTIQNLGWLRVTGGLPETVYINPRGKIVYVHTGEYDSQGTLDRDIATEFATAAHK